MSMPPKKRKKKKTETASSVRVHCTIEVGLEGFEIVTVSIRLLLLFITNSSQLMRVVGPLSLLWSRLVDLTRPPVRTAVIAWPSL